MATCLEVEIQCNVIQTDRRMDVARSSQILRDTVGLRFVNQRSRLSMGRILSIFAGIGKERFRLHQTRQSAPNTQQQQIKRPQEFLVY